MMIRTFNVIKNNFELFILKKKLLNKSDLVIDVCLIISEPSQKLP